MAVPPLAIEVSVADQSLTLLREGEPVATYPISTSAAGTGCEEGSNCTPMGNFEIGEKIGDGAAAGTIFRSREVDGHWEPGQVTDEDLVLTRILWLHGLDEANANTRERYIYIHGTNQEELIGSPVSHGCVRMRNADVIELYDLVPEGTPMRIV